MAYTQRHTTEDYLRKVTELVLATKQQTYKLMRIAPGHKVFDLGCGPGTDTITLATLVGEQGEVIGLDHSQAMIEKATQRAVDAKVSHFVRHELGDALSLPFAAERFDACRSERVFQHLSDPEQAFAEMVRVTKHAGWLVVLDTDWSTLSIDTPERSIEFKLRQFHAEHGFRRGFIGRELYRMFVQTGLTEIEVEIVSGYNSNYKFTRQIAMLDEAEVAAVSAGVITSEELQRWHSSLEKADAEGTFFAAMNQTLIAGRKP